MELFMSLKLLTASIHKEAEEMKWSKLLVSGNMTRKQYGQYLYNQLQIYSALENRAFELGFFKKYPFFYGIRRALAMSGDLAFYEHDIGLEPATLDYIDYISYASEAEVIAHMYVRHFGDMYGGQIIRKNLPEPYCEAVVDPETGIGAWIETPEMYQSTYIFENRPELIKEFRTLLDTSMGDDAISCFEYAMRLFSDLEKRFDL
jgi:heme oxygenase